MRRFITFGDLARLAAVFMILNCCYTTVLLAETERAQPSLKELIETQPPSAGSGTQSVVGVTEDPLSRGTPQGSVRGYLLAARDRDYTRAAEYLDLRNLPPGFSESQGPALARQLKIILDRTLWVDLETLSTDPEGNLTDALPAVRDRIGSINAQGKTYDLLVQRVPRGDGVYIWKISSVTVADIPKLYQQFGYGVLEPVLPAWLFDVSVLGIHLWLWVIIIAICAILYPVAMGLTKIVFAFLHPLNPDLALQLQKAYSSPVTLLVWTLLVRGSSSLVGHSVVLRAIEETRTVQVIALTWFLMRTIDLVAQRVGTQLDRKGLSGSRVLLAPACRVIKFLALVAALLLWLDNAGYKVTTLLAGVSIGGVAVALASQKSLENIFGAVTLFTARPIKVGDFCRFGNEMGTVEDIGLRATRIRTLNRTVITVANAEFAGLHLENFSDRDRYWYHPTLQLRYETTPDQVRYILIEIRKILYAHPKVLTDPLHVRFTRFGPNSLDIDVFCYIGVTNYTESLEVAEDLNLRIMDIIHAAGSEFAFPVLAKALDENRAKAIGNQIQEWKEQRQLYLPNFPKETISRLKGSLDYPLKGSPHFSGPQAGNSEVAAMGRE